MSVIAAETHIQVVDITDPDRRPSVLMIVANPGINATTGRPVGFWASELFHPYHAFVEKRYDVTIASPEGGKVEVDALSDPRDESKMSADDLISMGALNAPAILAQLENTPAIRDLDLADYDAIVVCGGQGPMFQFRDHEDLKGAIRTFYEARKPTAALCHGTCALLDVKLSDGLYLIEGKAMTGFANVEEDFSDASVGQKTMPFRIEDDARGRGANYVQAGLFKAFAIRDMNLITGQQAYSGTKVAEFVIESLGD